MKKNISEVDTRANYIDPKFTESDWTSGNIEREFCFTDGMKLLGNKRSKRLFLDYLVNMKKLFLPFIISSFFACKGDPVPQTKPTKEKGTTVSIPQPTPIKDSIPAKHLRNKELFNVEGRYSLEPSDSDCKFDLTLYREKGELRYKLVTKTRNLTGDAEIELNEKNDGYYLDLKDLEWSENEGAVNDEGEPIEKDIELPTTVQGVLYEDEITIQNGGNSMNYYVKIGECDLKYIVLKRKASVVR